MSQYTTSVHTEAELRSVFKSDVDVLNWYIRTIHIIVMNSLRLYTKV